MSPPRAPRWATSASDNPPATAAASASPAPSAVTASKDHRTSTPAPTANEPPSAKAPPAPSSRASSVARDRAERAPSSSRRSRAPPPIVTSSSAGDSSSFNRVLGAGSTASPTAPPSATSNGTSSFPNEAGPSTPAGAAPKKKHRRGWKGWKIEVEDEFGNKILKSPSPEPELPPGAPKRPRGRPRTRMKVEDVAAPTPEQQQVAQTSGATIPDGAAVAAISGEVHGADTSQPPLPASNGDAHHDRTPQDHPKLGDLPPPTTDQDGDETFYTPEVPMLDDLTAEARPSVEASGSSGAKRSRDNTSFPILMNSPEPPSKRSRTPRMTAPVSSGAQAASVPTSFATRDATTGERLTRGQSQQAGTVDDGSAARSSAPRSRRPSHASTPKQSTDAAQFARPRSGPSRDSTPLPAATRHRSSSNASRLRATPSTHPSSNATQKPSASSSDTRTPRDPDSRRTGMGVYPSPPESDERGRDPYHDHDHDRHQDRDIDADDDHPMDVDERAEGGDAIEVLDDDEEQDPETERRLRDVVNEAEYIINATNLRRKEASDRQQALDYDRRVSRDRTREHELERERERERDLDRERERELQRLQYERERERERLEEYRARPTERRRSLWEEREVQDLESSRGSADWGRRRWRERSLDREHVDRAVRPERERERERLWRNADDDRRERREDRVWDRREYDSRREYEVRSQPVLESSNRPFRGRHDPYDPVDVRDRERRLELRDPRDPIDMRDPWMVAREPRDQRPLTTSRHPAAASRAGQSYSSHPSGSGYYSQQNYAYASGTSAANYYPAGQPAYTFDPRDPRDLRDLRDGLDPRNPRDPRTARDLLDLREVRDLCGPRDPRDARDLRDPRDPREPRNSRTHDRDDWYQRAAAVQEAVGRPVTAPATAKLPAGLAPTPQPPTATSRNHASSHRLSTSQPQPSPIVDSIRYPESPFVAPEPQVPDLAFDYPAIVLAPKGGEYDLPADATEANYARLHREGYDGLDAKLEDNAAGFLENVKNNLRTLVSSYFSQPSAKRDAFLERVGRDLGRFGLELTDSADGALYTRPPEVRELEPQRAAERAARDRERDRGRERDREMAMPGSTKVWHSRHSLQASHPHSHGIVDGPSPSQRSVPDGIAGPSPPRRGVVDGLDHGSAVPRRSLPALTGPLHVPGPLGPLGAPGSSGRPKSQSQSQARPVTGAGPGGVGSSRHSVPIAPKPRDLSGVM